MAFPPPPGHHSPDYGQHRPQSHPGSPYRGHPQSGHYPTAHNSHVPNGGSPLPAPGQYNPHAVFHSARARKEKSGCGKAALIIGISLASILLLGVIMTIYFLFQSGTSDSDSTPGSSAQTVDELHYDGPGLTLGTGEIVVDVFLDYLCGACQNFDAEYGDQLRAMALNDDITLNYIPVDNAGYNQGSATASGQSAAAAACFHAHAEDSFGEFHRELLRAQPPQETGAMQQADLIEFADQFGMSTELEACLAEGTFGEFGMETSAHAALHGITNTPSVWVDGESVDTFGVLDAIGQR
ncbi:DsbA family protein [Natronoglycomyces albus]|uniref:Thioredoxin domain-containing protein n=1 Tax=Natronoglycomyces albus TaxID=2811108 RepID=A0A895XNH0_9ACTN|nr:thioredoxin domain-containing protein [Natronoglycomyces albus]QSB04036.1 thioredoxin domain-containing protein [Natronoglycomyces albus]